MQYNDLRTTTVDLIRHGEPVGGRRYRGQLDDPLSERGWEQMRSAVADHCPWDQIISSPLQRCRAFAEEVARRHGLAVQFDEGLKELGFGEWEGRTAAQLLEADSGSIQRFWSDPLNNRPPGAECLHDFEARVTAAWDRIVAEFRGRHVLLVGHAGLIRMILRHVLQMPLENMFRIQVPNAALTRIRIEHYPEGDLPRLVFHDGRL